MTLVKMRTIDLETAGMDPPASVIEIGYTDLIFDTETKAVQIGETHSLLFKPREKLTADNIAVHHLTPPMLADWPHCEEHDLLAVAKSGEPQFLIAANADFERKWITPEMTGETRWICTVKTAGRIYPEAPSHSNQAMRYFLELDLPEARAMPPHRAGPDSFVTAHILANFLQTERVLDLVKWTFEPKYLPVCPLHKHKGTPWPAVPYDYLLWIIRTTDLDADVRHAADMEMERRKSI